MSGVGEKGILAEGAAGVEEPAGDLAAEALAAAADMGKQKRATRVALKGRIRAKAREKVKRSAAAKHKRLAWLRSARVLDLDAFRRLRGQGAGSRRVARAMGIPLTSAVNLVAGTHWQQDPEKVGEFNRFHDASVDVATGVPTARDLEKHGRPDARPKASDSDGTKDLRRIAEDAGVPQQLVATAMRRQRILAGAWAAGDLPASVDTKWLQDSVDQTLGVIMTLMDPVTLAGASLADLTRAANVLFEKRALLRGEPTSIVRNEHRGGLDKLAELLLGEVQRRGVQIDIPKSAYREVSS